MYNLTFLIHVSVTHIILLVSLKKYTYNKNVSMWKQNHNYHGFRGNSLRNQLSLVKLQVYGLVWELSHKIKDGHITTLHAINASPHAKGLAISSTYVSVDPQLTPFEH